MKIAYHSAQQVTAAGIQQRPLVIDTRRGRILPADHPVDEHLNLESFYLYPGLINAHDHLELNHYPRTRFRDVYDNASAWAADVSAHLHQAPFAELQQFNLADRCLIGGLKNLFSGVTIVAHHNPLHRPLKSRWFPVDVVRRYGWAHSLYLASPPDIQRGYRQTRRGVWMIHLAEGTDPAAAAEWEQLRALGCVSEKTILIHGVGLTDPAQAADQTGGLVWCPSTNRYLLGQTAAVRPWQAVGKLALGSDSRLTADGDLLDELQSAYKTGQLTPQALFLSVTAQAAACLQLQDVGDLQPGMRANVLALPARLHPDPYLALLRAKRSDVAWVMRGGHIIWQQTHHNPNCLLDAVPYRMATRLLRRVQRSALTEPGLQLL